MPNWFRRKRIAPTDAVRDFVDTVEMINALLLQEASEHATANHHFRGTDGAAHQAAPSSLG
jgi:hypothetical protein